MDKFLFKVRIGSSDHYFNVNEISAIVQYTDFDGAFMYRIYLSHPIPGIEYFSITEDAFNRWIKCRVLQ